MRRFIGLCAPLLLLIALAGCGTIANMKGGYIVGPHVAGYPQPYGGVILNAHRLVECAHHFTADPMNSGYGIVVLIADMPLSAIGDTLTLPWLPDDAGAEQQPLPKGVIPAGPKLSPTP